ncbi:hypothetical protein, conserved [Leishmania lindenbergi]|uniref:Uncharacterized protein n=1 Tax=Leishmania lindenbergi TaxID=651832 RepID=A0AAW3AC26_9TRYP
MGHTITRNKPQSEKLKEAIKTNEAPSPITAKRGAQVTAVTHEKVHRIDSDQGLTEEMIEGLTGSSASSIHSKKKKEALSDWITAANCAERHNVDVLKQHEDSMRALTAMQTARNELRSLSKLRHRRSSRSKDSRGGGSLDTDLHA